MDEYAYLREHDPQWLDDTLQARARHIRQRNAEHDSAITTSQQPCTTSIAPAGPHDVTVAELAPGRVVSDHVKLIRQHNWASTALGPMSMWSTELRRMVNVCLQDNKPAALWWGETRSLVYNEAYQHVLAQKHPAVLGWTVNEVWPELKDSEYGQSFDHADDTGEASFGDKVPFHVDRAGYMEEVWASWVNVPIPGPHGNLGYYNTVVDVTQEVVYNRRIATLQSCDQSISAAETVRDYWIRVLRGFEKNEYEVPFAVLYGPATQDYRRESVRSSSVADDDGSSQSEHSSMFAGTEWVLEGVVGGSGSALPQRVDLDSGSELLSPLLQDAMTSKTVKVLNVAEGNVRETLSDAAYSRSFKGDKCTTIVLLPIWSTYQEHRSGFILLGINTRRKYDVEYQRFVRLLHQQLTASLSTLVMAEDEARRARVAARLAAKDRIRLVENLAKSKQEAQQNEVRFRSMADLAPVGIFELDVSGNLLYANQQFLEMTECPVDKASDISSLTQSIHADDRESALLQWSRLLVGDEVHFESRLKRPFVTSEVYSGERMTGETWVLTAAYAMRDDTSGADGDMITGIFGCLVDISRQKWMEGFQERQVKEHLERRRQQENFMDSTNHEARNPLAAITLCADDVFKTVSGVLKQNSQAEVVLNRDNATAILESVEIIMACAKHQKRIIDDVLTISKLDSEMLSMSPSPMQPTAVVNQSLKMLKGELQRTDIDLRYTVGASYQACMVDWVMLDATRFLQILINLLTNAVKFTKHENSRKIVVTLDASLDRPTGVDFGVRFAPDVQRPSSVTTAKGGVYLVVTIKDTGPGIMDDELQNLFQRFQQASPKTYAQYGGSGLGLWISKELCGKLGGQIGVASTSSATSPGGTATGTTFCFFVQASRCSPPETEVRHPNGQPVQMQVMSAGTVTMLDEGIAAINAHLEAPAPEPIISTLEKHAVATVHAIDADPATIDVLVVEDNLVNQRVMKKQLVRAGFRVSVANHGKEALDLLYSSTLGNAKFDVVLMDIEMPVMGGLECTRIIRFREQESELRTHLPILGVTANARAEQLAAALDAGMDRVVTKPFHMSELLPAIELVQKGPT